MACNKSLAVLVGVVMSYASQLSSYNAEREKDAQNLAKTFDCYVSASGLG